METEILKSIPFFSVLEDEVLASLAGLFTLDAFDANTCIVEEGKPIDALYIVMQGVVHARKTGKDKQILLGRIGRGGFFGEVNLFAHGDATASIQSMDAVKLAVVKYDTLREFMEENPSAGYRIASNMMKELARRLRQTNDRLLSSLYWKQ